MKSVVDLFVVKDRTAIFWFTVACVSIVCSAIFVQRVITAVQVKPQYVIMDSTGSYYLAPSVEFEKALELHAAQTRLAMETLYTRGPEMLTFESRLKKLFTQEANTQIRKDLLNPDEKPFREQQIHQSIQIEQAGVYKNLIDPRGQAVTFAKGKLTREITFKGQSKTEVLDVEVYFWWRINTRMADNGLFPTVCTKFKASDPKRPGEVDAAAATASSSSAKNSSSSAKSTP
ncbi:hypothetical protein DES53_101947 [Roseimicrobium gellanilyticum]|uniref:Bacterial virulence protein VirB8 domain-containing protein n=1 Tax=Roseimicrobium gellanilyticum TaxID=748857 RepID=A0A366HVM2_9BACT|nr:hypothetical protein [Roseimicrobium gellanilyticum]RBP48147.1 hypothetical protein DES53_101947 [Roseimicrobium gellanilyticum]